MRITNLPPSLPVSSTASAQASKPASTSFGARLQSGVASGAAPTASPVSGQNVLAAAMGAQQDSSGGAVGNAYGMPGPDATGLDASLGRIAQTPEQFAALKGIVMAQFQSNASSIFGMSGHGVTMEME